MSMPPGATSCAIWPHISGPVFGYWTWVAGPGFISIRLAEAVAPGEVYGIDMEPSQIEMARELAAERGCDNASFHVADIAELPFEDGFFDVACCNDVLAYVPDTGAALSEVKRVLKPGGVFGCRENHY